MHLKPLSAEKSLHYAQVYAAELAPGTFTIVVGCYSFVGSL